LRSGGFLIRNLKLALSNYHRLIADFGLTKFRIGKQAESVEKWRLSNSQFKIRTPQLLPTHCGFRIDKIADWEACETVSRSAGFLIRNLKFALRNYHRLIADFGLTKLRIGKHVRQCREVEASNSQFKIRTPQLSPPHCGFRIDKIADWEASGECREVAAF